MPAEQYEKYIERALSFLFAHLAPTAETGRVLRKIVRIVMRAVVEKYMVAVVGVE
jgi:hypothetical protein